MRYRIIRTPPNDYEVQYRKWFRWWPAWYDELDGARSFSTFADALNKLTESLRKDRLSEVVWESE